MAKADPEQPPLAHTFTYTTLTPAHAEAWRALRLEGARDFPLGFLVSAREAEALTVERCAEILKFGALRGVLDAGRLIGFCGYRPQRFERTRHRAEIGPFFVTAAAHGTGAAQVLMDGILAEARADDVARMELTVDAENARAIAFYTRNGFQRIATLEDNVRLDGVSRTDLWMVLRLDAPNVSRK
ncbi:MAG: GNAT family N-acetyltransferase [Pseudomonadota bacterium]